VEELIADHKRSSQTREEPTNSPTKNDDVTTASLLETFIDGAGRRLWFLFAMSRV
jgi:DNA-binding ferritin-like protein